ncbi:bL12 family ribosomal protein [Oscillatoria sp. FACHB-1407]|uniref:bL12 family ribosomal protein n=1 Tax=Oscillatoria sp. FACHB-1407 TaxID=2692847 RepID=UPI001F54F868|nr:bL12 family ribosomal protein [Oscillatoria sp. FACHB-1407]
MDFWLVVSLLGGLVTALIVLSNFIPSSPPRRSLLQNPLKPDTRWQLDRMERKLDLILEHLGIQLDATEFDVILAEVPPTHKISVIKTVRELTSLRLKDAKELVESAPVLLQTRSPLEKATTIKRHLEEAGAIVTITPHL